ncbi:hypothetical protein [Methylacidimicrobium cyclopophantes]|nr:hypothetical protein [Methylacidimicrobium cyclopophantes]
MILANGASSPGEPAEITLLNADPIFARYDAPVPRADRASP